MLAGWRPAIGVVLGVASIATSYCRLKHMKRRDRQIDSPFLTVGPVARARNGVIGRAGALPWRIPSDLRLFKALTLGKPVIMGRRTWESLPRRPLPGRLNLVLSSDGGFEPKGAVACEDFSEAVSIAREQAAEDGAEEVCVIGGAALFALALPRARRLYLSEIDADVEGEVLMPPFDEGGWREVRREARPAEANDDYGFTFRVLERNSPSDSTSPATASS